MSVAWQGEKLEGVVEANGLLPITARWRELPQYATGLFNTPEGRDEAQVEAEGQAAWKALGEGEEKTEALSQQRVGWMMVLSRRKSAAYWEGWQAVEQHRTCSYTELKDREEWARGFSDGVDEERGSKVWYKSKTMIVGLVLLMVGAGVAVYGVAGGGGQVYTGFGSGVGSSSLLMTALRLITGTSVSFSGGGSQYTPPPFSSTPGV